MNRRKCSINNHVADAPVAPIHEIAWLHSMKSANVGLKAPASVTTSYDLVFPSAAPGTNGYLLSSDTSGTLSWVAPSAGSVTSVTATAPVASTGGATPVISMTQANASTAGYLSSADWNTFNDKQGTSLASANILVGNGSGVASAVAPSGDVTMTNAGAFTVTKIRGSTVSATTPTTDGQMLRFNGTQWVPNFISMFDLRSTITGAVSFGAGCTAGQTLTWTSATDNLACTTIAINDSQVSNTVSRTANTFLAAPNGSAGAATYRGIASADLPSLSSGLTGTLPAANGGTGQASYTVGDLLYASTTTALSKLPASTSGYVLTSGGAGVAPSWTAPPSGPLSGLSAATGVNAINNANYAQTWNWNSATTENPMALTANALTTGSLLSLSTSSGSINSTNGLLNVTNSSATTTGVLARFQANSTVGSGMTVLATGNVGIGTTSPAQKITVSENVTTLPAVSQTGVARFSAADNANTRVYIDGFGTGYPLLKFQKAKGTAASPSAVSTYDTLGSVGFQGYGTTGYSNLNRAAIIAQATENWTDSAQGTNMSFQVTNNGTTTAQFPLTITAGGSVGIGGNITDLAALTGSRVTVLSSGNVGIGTTSPTAPLEVVGNLKAGSSNTTSGANVLAVGSSNTASGTNAIALGDGNLASGTRSFAAGSFNTASGAYSTAVGASSVASGSTSFAVGYSALASGDYSNAIGQYVTSESFAQTTIGRYNLPKGSETAGSWVATDPLFVVGNGSAGGAARSTAMMVLKNGNVGIGTTNPGARLDIVAVNSNATALKTSGYLLTGTDASSLMNLSGTWNTTGVPSLLTANVIDTASGTASKLLDLQVNGSTKFSVGKAGNLMGQGGIVLQANGNSQLGLDISNLDSGANAMARVLFMNDNYSPAVIGIPSSSHAYADQLFVESAGMVFNSLMGNKVLFRTNSTDRVLIDASGNVGIGTTSPGAKLDVTDTSTTTSAIIVPRAGNFTGTNVDGMVRYNNVSTLFEFRQNGAWVNYTTVSDGRLKTHVIPITDGLAIVNQLNPVFYDWDRNNPKASNFEDKHQVGFIAQEVEQVLPEVVNKGQDSYRSLEYGKIVSVVVAAVKELYSKVLGIDRELASLKAGKADKTEVDQLKIDNAAKDKRIEDLEQRLEKIEKALNSK